jgi:GNAT superfamily N-acetyltransferase
MGIEYRTEPPDQNAYFRLFESTGWNNGYHFSAEELSQAIQQSWHLVAAYDRDTLVGFGRLISDGVHHALLVDLIVLPGYQGQGIGGTILKQLVDKCQAHGIRDVQLFCARGKAGFYQKFGFVARPMDAPGMQLKRP